MRAIQTKAEIARVLKASASGSPLTRWSHDQNLNGAECPGSNVGGARKLLSQRRHCQFS